MPDEEEFKDSGVGNNILSVETYSGGGLRNSSGSGRSGGCSIPRGRKGSHDSVASGRSNSLSLQQWRKESVTIIEHVEPINEQEDDKEEGREENTSKRQSQDKADRKVRTQSIHLSNLRKSVITPVQVSPEKESRAPRSEVQEQPQQRPQGNGTEENLLSVPKLMTASSSAETLTGEVIRKYY